MTKRCQIIPPDELPCVWMSAGMLSFQLCDRGFDCDHCPLDAAIRKSRPRRESSTQADSAHAQETLPCDRVYSGNHLWVKDIRDRMVRIGIEPRLGLALIGSKTVVFPAEGQHVSRGQTCIWIVMDGGTLPMESPLSGVMRATNRHLADNPHLLRLHPLDHGWLYDFEIEEAAASPELMNAEQADPKYAQDDAALASLLTRALEHGRREVGLTLADGGQQLQSAADMLGPARYFALLRKIYG